ncbi:hypothetical protein J6590_099083 [Homalodisca vitripennis]|nr:hypothetical protein J6590_099083 [Homalodisca vitripennis]
MVKAKSVYLVVNQVEVFAIVVVVSRHSSVCQRDDYRRAGTRGRGRGTTSSYRQYGVGHKCFSGSFLAPRARDALTMLRVPNLHPHTAQLTTSGRLKVPAYTQHGYVTNRRVAPLEAWLWLLRSNETDGGWSRDTRRGVAWYRWAAVTCRVRGSSGHRSCQVSLAVGIYNHYCLLVLSTEGHY